MHEDEAHVDAALVRRLLAQFPQWADLPVVDLVSAGSDNALYRAGDDLVVRFPRIESASRGPAKDHEWLPKLAPRLPLTVPMPLALGSPSDGYPWAWSAYRWVPGDSATSARIDDPERAAVALAGFVVALQAIDAEGGPVYGEHNAGRGEPLSRRDEEVRVAIDVLGDAVDADVAAAAWDESLQAPEWRGPNVWLHGDLAPTNLLVDDGELSAVIDFGCLAVGDPACDLMPAWTFCTAATRSVFRSVVAPDDAAWARGRGWALSFGLIALPYYRETNPVLAGAARRSIDEALADFRASAWA